MELILVLVAPQPMEFGMVIPGIVYDYYDALAIDRTGFVELIEKLMKCLTVKFVELAPELKGAIAQADRPEVAHAFARRML